MLFERGLKWLMGKDLTFGVKGYKNVISSGGVKIILKSSPIEGIGAFAVDKIAEGSTITYIHGDIYTRAECEAAKEGSSSRFIQIGDDKFIGPPKAEKGARPIEDYFNHSCSPNCAILECEGEYRLVTLRTIEAGEELCWDYSTFIDDPEEKMECNCGYADCRKVIGSFGDLSPEIRNWYLGSYLVADFIAQKYR